MTSSSPTGLPPTTPAVVAGRLIVLVAVWAVALAVVIGAGRLRERHVHEPTCTPVCVARGMRYEGVTQHRKIDTAAACVCVSSRGDRAEVPTRFFSSVGALDTAAAIGTSTMGVLVLLGLVGLAAYVAARALRARRGT